MITLNNKYPKILTHNDIFKNSNFFGSSHYVINKDLQLFPNRCPHRGNKIISPGTTKEEFKCGLHGWSWTKHGLPTNNDVNIKFKNATKGQSGLIFLDWEEPINVKWVEDLKTDQLEYSHSIKKQGTGDWRWQMEMHVDLLHVEQIHPLLTSYVNCTNLISERGDDWIAQHHEHGWWLFVYPFTHIEWEPGCLYFSEMTPREAGIGYDICIHYLFNKNVPLEQRKHFANMAEITVDEDIQAVNDLSLSSKYRMPGNNPHPLESDIVHFYKWVEENTE